MSHSKRITSLVERVHQSLIRHTNLLEVAFRGGELSGFIEVRAARDDTPRLIGKGGAHFRALSWMITQGASIRNVHFALRVLEAVHPGTGERLPKFRPNPNWPRKEIEQLVRDLADWTFEVGHGVAFRVSDDKVGAEVAIKVPAYWRDDAIPDAAEHFTALLQGICLTNGCVISVAVIR